MGRKHLHWIQGALGGISALIVVKYFVLGEARWNDLLAPLHAALPGNVADETGTP